MAAGVAADVMRLRRLHFSLFSLSLSLLCSLSLVRLRRSRQLQPAGTLAVDETVDCTAQHTVTQAEMDDGSNVDNIGTADSNETEPVDDDVTIPVSQDPDLFIAKASTTTDIFAGVASPSTSRKKMVVESGSSISRMAVWRS